MKNIVDKIIDGRDLSKEGHRKLVESIIETITEIRPRKDRESDIDALSEREVCSLTGLTRYFLRKKIDLGDFPDKLSIKCGNAYLWSRTEVKAWIEKQRDPTAEEVEIKKMSDKMVKNAYKNY